MATLTCGTLATTTLTTLQFPSFSATSFSDADVATITNLIVNDQEPTLAQVGAWSRVGILYVPGRGFLKCLPGDWVAVSSIDGWPILISPIAMATTTTLTVGNTVSSPTLIPTTSALAAGWQIGGHVTGTQIPANSLITNISANGLVVTLNKNSTGTNAAITATYGAWTHS